ncbi:MAG TPA: hypothetical protein VEV41_10630 [Terriglobales bacterium]|nr:hypothetical protein [Terriglobales bacterium]
MFYFEQLLNTALGGIDATNVIPTVSNMAFAILLIGFLVGLYQAILRGGDLQALAVTAIKYLVVAMIVANWSTVFRDVNGSFNAVASFIGNSSSAGDMFINWMSQLQQQAQSNPGLTFWDMITGDSAGTTTVLMLLVAYVIYALAIIVFCFFYTLFGCVLYVLGPLVLALTPISGIGQLGKTYAINVMIWNAWGILYAVFGALITAIHFNQVNDVLGNGFLGFLRGVPDSVILGLVSIAYALAIALVPFIARKVISGDVGSTAFAFVRAGAMSAGAPLAGVSGFAIGSSSAAAGSGSSTAGAGVSAVSGSSAIASSTPPPVPTMPEFLRSGVRSAMKSNASPPAASPTNGQNSSRAAAVVAGSSGPGISYRPRGVVQVISFNAGKALGRVAGSRRDDDSNE